MKIHKSITVDKLIDAVERRNNCMDNPGFCIACGEESDSCEPDARGYMCESCGQPKVFAAEELLLKVAI